MSTIFKIFLLLLVLIFSALLIRTSQLLWTDEQSQFTRGTVTVLPDGLYTGTVAGPSFSWKGKWFDRSGHTGINIFAGANGDMEKYPFTESVGSGVHDDISVIRIDYNVSQNPWWLRPVLDEVVEVAPGAYLGKLQLRIIPGYPFTLTYFTLTASS